MKTSFVRGMAFIACISNVQAMDSHMNPTSNNETEEQTNKVSQKRLYWRQDCDVIRIPLQKTILDFLTDEEGNHIDIDSLTDDKFRDLAKNTSQILAREHCSPMLYKSLLNSVFDAVLSSDELRRVSLEQVWVFFEEFEKIELQEWDRYNASFS